MTPAQPAVILNHARVLVTRPAALAHNLCSQIESSGGSAISSPMIEITTVVNDASLVAALDSLSEIDIAIFISPSSVLQTLLKADDAFNRARQLKIAAIGRASAAQLQNAGLTVDIIPRSPYNSEALLEHEALQNEAVCNRRIMIFRGDSGRNLLYNTLRERGAEVAYVQTYTRIRPSYDMKAALHNWKNHQVNVITLNSRKSLNNLYDLIAPLDSHWLLNTPLIVHSPECHKLANELGFSSVHIAEDATNSAMMTALNNWCTNDND